MLNARSFSEILEDMMEETETPAMEYSPGFSIDPSIANTWVFTNVSRAYPVVRKAFVKPKPAPSHTMTDEQALGFAFLKNLVNSLQDNFNLKELKSAYRLAVLKTHPDQGGTSESFQQVKKSYQILMPLVNKGA